MEKLAGNLRFLREKFQLKQSDMQDRLDIKRTTWIGYEAGNSNPYVKDLVRIAAFFGVTENDLLHTDLIKNPGLVRRNAPGLKKLKGTEDTPLRQVAEDQKQYGIKSRKTANKGKKEAENSYDIQQIQADYKTILAKLAALEKKIGELGRSKK